MAAELATTRGDALEQVLIQGDLKALTPEQRTQYYQRVCDSLGLNPLTRPFEYLTFQGKLILYARRDCTEQLRKRDGIGVEIVSRELVGDVYVVSARARDKAGRTDESIGAVAVLGLKGEALANAMMKAETKAKRRVTLSICGLGMLDETEAVADPAAPVAAAQPAPEVRQLAAPKPQPAPNTDGPTLGEEMADYIRSAATLDELKRVWVHCDTSHKEGRLTRAEFEELAGYKDQRKAWLAAAPAGK